MTDGRRPDGALPKRSLGTRRDTPFTYSPDLLEAIPASPEAPHVDQTLWIALHGLRFTCLCPVTGQPDWAELYINYIPAERLVESKSLKEYLGSFRMHGAFHEDVCRLICSDLVALLDPRYLEVTGLFDSRGSISIHPYAQHARPDDAEMRKLLETRRGRWAPGPPGPPDG